ncbi:MAG: glycosyltransferase [Xanthobacteraceae bacterium]
MLSVVIATHDSERALLATLAALVPGATEGLIREVIVADAGSRDDTAVIADVAGCNFIAVEGTLGRRLGKAAAAARAPYLLFLQPGIVLESGWIGEARRFAQRPKPLDRVAIFQRGGSRHARLRDAWAVLIAALGAAPRPDQGLLIGGSFYASLGGHSENAADPERDLLRRIGRRRIVTLTAAANHILD